jgi:hypothetical protein
VDTSLPSSRTPAWEGALLLKPLVSFWHNAQQTFVFHFHLELVVLSLSGLGLPFHTSYLLSLSYFLTASQQPVLTVFFFR